MAGGNLPPANRLHASTFAIVGIAAPFTKADICDGLSGILPLVIHPHADQDMLSIGMCLDMEVGSVRKHFTTDDKMGLWHCIPREDRFKCEKARGNALTFSASKTTPK
jgi:hypothetical protein